MNTLFAKDGVGVSSVLFANDRSPLAGSLVLPCDHDIIVMAAMERRIPIANFLYAFNLPGG